ncbi:monooxygenase [Tepidamorphus sp. 3E244]|uniref:monooxygenase n=1 Tax=Tepidamorphus sp. 3E244 TaxID=3385498 RepID=UPI0038FC82F9
MITAIVRFPLPPGTSLEEAKTLFEQSAPNYEGADGLVRKYYLFGEGPEGGGVYLWESREAADKVYSQEWRQMIAERYGKAPEISYFETPVIVDNKK